MGLGKQVSKIILFILLAFFALKNGNCQTYGLYFSGPEVSKDARTGLDLSQFKTFNFKDGFSLSFEIMLRSLEYEHFGFIARIIADDSNNIDLIYNNQQGSNEIVLITGNNLNPVSYPVSKMKNEWTKVVLTCEPGGKSCKLSIADSILQISTPKFSSGKHFKIFFGAVPGGTFETSDVPAMNLKNIQLSENEEPIYNWLLDEREGEFATDQFKKLKVKAYNPVWLSKKHNNWELIKSIKILGDAAITFNHITNNLIIADENELTKFNIMDLIVRKTAYQNNAPNIITSDGNIFVDDSTGIVYCYDVRNRDVSSFNPKTGSWEKSSTIINTGNKPYTHNKIYSNPDKKLYIFGGYADNFFQNELIELDLGSRKWTTINTIGNSISPRYMSGIGLNSANDTIFLAGGYGSSTGNPILNAHYCYELYTLDLNNRKLKKFPEYSSNIHNFSFANSLLIDGEDHTIFGLCFSSHKFNCDLQLIKSVQGSKDWIEMGDKIPYLFQKNQSYADLFYSDKLQKLIAVTIFKDENNKSTVDTYTINYPPNKSIELINSEKDQHKAWYWIIMILLFDIVLFIGFLIRKRISDKLRLRRLRKETENRKAMEATIQALADSEKPKSSIFLFGGFQVFDKNGEDVSKLFTPLVKELFLIILLYPFKNGKGVTSKRLTEMLWFDKPSEKAVNNRSVNMGKLKKILSLIGSNDLSNSNGYWTFTFNEGYPKMYIDIIEFQQIIQQENIEEENIQRLIKIVQKGSLLTFLNYDWLDEIKERISSRLIDVFIEYLENNSTNDVEFIIKLADSILIFDPINEQAIAFKCRALINIGQHGVAQKTFQKFITEYEQLYAVPFDKTLKDLINP